MVDVVIGTATNYDYDKIEPWVVSLKRSGFDGKIALVVYNMKKDTVDRLVADGVALFGFQKDDEGNFTYPSDNNFSIMVERFAHIWYFLSKADEEIEHIISTDVKDVIFQKNPSDFFSAFDRKEIFVGCENFKYKDEPWGKNNLIQSFGPMLYEKLKDNPIYCAGVIAGKKQAILDLFLNVFLLCRGAPAHVPGGGGPDQAALNILLSLDSYKSITNFCSMEHDFVCHAGTTTHAIKSGKGVIGEEYLRDPSSLYRFNDVMLGKDPIYADDTVYNSYNTPYYIVHQYDRVNEWKDILDRKYRN